ncbi:cache domain-containing sensor histidine kinase [Paenibacillus pinistramenti]|uniref:cache domain-containing sensor histidine kinase n=1 Tax=Paenibacillus pinistramenti TaxID=1768003 RepID=UPI0011095368|nr:sensor histidine kinase [Paenibacillus pinistramenti]
MKGWKLRLGTRYSQALNRMETKLLIVFLFLIILPIGVLSYLSALRYSSSIENTTVSYASQLSDQMMTKLDDYMEDMKKISIIPSYLGEIKTGLKMSNSHYQGQSEALSGTPSILPGDQQWAIDIQKKIGNSIYFLNNVKSGTNTVYLFDRFGHVYYASKSLYIRSDLSTVYPEWKKLADAANGTPVLVSTQEVTQTANTKRYVFTVVRAIIDPDNYEPLGMIAVDANIGVIENIVKDLDQVTAGTTLIIDDSGRVIYDSEKKYLAQSMPRSDLTRRMSGEQGSFKGEVDGEQAVTIYKQSSRTGWKVLITIPEQHLMEDAVQTRNLTIVTAIIIMSFALLISLVMVFALTRPLRSLTRLMKEVQKGNLDVVFPVIRRDEAGVVGNAFNRMLLRLKALIQDIYEVEQRKKEAELEALQLQINPHFIYNTLESIRMTAVIHDDIEVGDMTQLLGKLLRYSFQSGGTEVVPIEKEWEHLRIYVELLNYRYGNRFELILPDPEETAGMSVMKLLFQPIVENAVYHGLQESNENMVIRIEHSREGKDLDHVFRIIDNGSGMSEDTLYELRQSLRSTRYDYPAGRGIGLRNVHERIRLRYGEAYGLSLQSSEGTGTVVTVTLRNQ